MNGLSFSFQNGNGTDSGVDSHKSEQSSVSSPRDSGVPIIAQQFSSSRRSGTPSPERKRKISPPRPGYQSIIHIGNGDDIDYEECETSSLLDNEDPGGGIDNDLNVEIPRARHVYIDIEKNEENMERALEHDLGIDSEAGKSKTAEYEIETDIVNGRNDNEQGRTTSDKTMGNPINQEYVEEEDMQNLAAKGKLASCSKMDYSVAAKTFNDEKTLNSVDDTSTGVPLKEFTRTILNPVSGVTDSYIDNGHMNGNLNKGMKPHSSMLDHHDEITAADTRLSKFPEDNSRKTPEVTLKNPLPNGIHLRPVINERNDNEIVNQTKSMQTNTADSNVVGVMNRAENCEDDDHSLSDIDCFDDDELNQSLGCGDGELTEILEALTNCRNLPELVELGPHVNGYVDHDQISICSFASNASSLQDRASPEKRVGVRQGSEHSSVAASPVLPRVTENVYKGSTEIEPKTVLKTENPDTLKISLKGIEFDTIRIRTTNNRSVDDIDTSKALKEMPDHGINKEVKLFEIDKHPNENDKETESVKNVVHNGLENRVDNISPGTGSGTGVSSYVHVTATGDPAEGDRNGQQTHL